MRPTTRTVVLIKIVASPNDSRRHDRIPAIPFVCQARREVRLPAGTLPMCAIAADCQLNFEQAKGFPLLVGRANVGIATGGKMPELGRDHEVTVPGPPLN